MHFSSWVTTRCYFIVWYRSQIHLRYNTCLILVKDISQDNADDSVNVFRRSYLLADVTLLCTSWNIDVDIICNSLSILTMKATTKSCPGVTWWSNATLPAIGGKCVTLLQYNQSVWICLTSLSCLYSERKLKESLNTQSISYYPKNWNLCWERCGG